MANFPDLPLEIRMMVYRLLLQSESRVYIGNPKGLAVGILRASRWVYNEAVPILYQENSFSLQSSGSRRIERFLAGIGSTNARDIRSVVLSIPRMLFIAPLPTTETHRSLECLRRHCGTIPSVTIEPCVDMRIMRAGSADAIDWDYAVKYAWFIKAILQFWLEPEEIRYEDCGRPGVHLLGQFLAAHDVTIDRMWDEMEVDE